MAPVFKHGKGVRPLIRQYDFSPFLNNVTVSASMDPAEVTTFQDNDKNYIAGLRDVTVSFDGFFSASTVAGSTEIANICDDALGSTSSPFGVTVAVDSSTGGRALMMQGDVSSYNTEVPLTDAVSLAVDVQGSGGYRGGVVLRPLSAATSTGSNGGVGPVLGSTAAGGTTGGGVAHLHLVSASTLTSVTFKVQHSTSGSTWADLITFTAATQATFQRSTVAGTVKERVRSTISAFTGGAGKSVTAAVAFARHGGRS